jgi:hypothetical protein
MYAEDWRRRGDIQRKDGWRQTAHTKISVQRGCKPTFGQLKAVYQMTFQTDHCSKSWVWPLKPDSYILWSKAAFLPHDHNTFQTKTEGLWTPLVNVGCITNSTLQFTKFQAPFLSILSCSLTSGCEQNLNLFTSSTIDTLNLTWSPRLEVRMGGSDSFLNWKIVGHVKRSSKANP